MYLSEYLADARNNRCQFKWILEQTYSGYSRYSTPEALFDIIECDSAEGEQW